MSAVVAVDAAVCIDAGVQLCTKPSGAFLMRETATPQCIISVASIGGTYAERLAVAQLTEDIAQDHPETPPDWGGSGDDVALSGAEGPGEEQPDSIRDDPMIPPQHAGISDSGGASRGEERCRRARIVDIHDRGKPGCATDR